MQILRLAAAAAFCVSVFAGCTSVAQGEAVSDDAAYYVIEVAPANTALLVEPGKIKDGEFRDQGPYAFDWAGSDPKRPDEGFIVAKAVGDRLMGIVFVGFETPPSVFRQGVFGLLMRDIKHSAGDTDYTSFGFCPSRPTIVFKAEAHRVLYIASLDFTFMADRSFLLGGRDKLAIGSSSNIEKARAFLAKKYPELAERLEPGTYDRYPIDRPCR